MSVAGPHGPHRRRRKKAGAVCFWRSIGIAFTLRPSSAREIAGHVCGAKKKKGGNKRRLTTTHTKPFIFANGHTAKWRKERKKDSGKTPRALYPPSPAQAKIRSVARTRSGKKKEGRRRRHSVIALSPRHPCRGRALWKGERKKEKRPSVRGNHPRPKSRRGKAKRE